MHQKFGVKIKTEEEQYTVCVERGVCVNNNRLGLLEEETEWKFKT